MLNFLFQKRNNYYRELFSTTDSHRKEKKNQKVRWLLPSVMSQGTPPRKTLQEYRGSLLFLGGSWPLQVKVASFTAEEFTETVGTREQRMNNGCVLRRLSYLQPVYAAEPPSQCWRYHRAGRAPQHQATGSQPASDGKGLKMQGWH